MRNLLIVFFCLLLAACQTPGPSTPKAMPDKTGTVLLYDNFDSENSGNGALNYSSFVKWTVSNGSVDLIGNGFHDFFPKNGLYVDLDGTTSDPAIMGSKKGFVLKPGVYRFEYDLAGSQRGDVNSVLIAVGASFLKKHTLRSEEPFRCFAWRFRVEKTDPNGYISFMPQDSGDNIGLLLDNVRLVKESEL
ncbi:MAG: hypothetical protein JRJ39_10865 [Deltaproteobacteria bacterium]|nr:hypothetical protein [Deltaproteobacteria bacterium]MBW1814137.1 hypothetical protein [Deltaproteobacteria bacterium]MBW1984848.1 hypothetical protein [Deltaproteobacteria bacterium]